VADTDPLNEAWKELIATAMRRNVVVAVGEHRAAVEATAQDEAIGWCIDIVQQSLDTVRAEDDGESRSIKTSIAAREHVIRLLAGYRAGRAALDSAQKAPHA
jgi:hypothetical protein